MSQKQIKNILLISFVISFIFIFEKKVSAETPDDFYRRCANSQTENIITNYPKTYQYFCCKNIPQNLDNDRKKVIDNLCKRAEETIAKENEQNCIILQESWATDLDIKQKLSLFEKCCIYCFQNPNTNTEKYPCPLILGMCNTFTNLINEYFAELGGVNATINPQTGQPDTTDIEKLKEYCLKNCKTEVDKNPIAYRNTCCGSGTLIQQIKETLTKDEQKTLDECCTNANSAASPGGIPSEPSTVSPVPTQQQGTSTTEKEDYPICGVIANKDYKACHEGKLVDWLWLCRIRAGIVHFFCSIGLRSIEGIGGGLSFLMNKEIDAIVWAMRPETYGGFANNPAVKKVWKFSRDIVYSFLIIGLVIVAFATMLKVEKWGWKNTLWKLIVVALLVNFSLIIPGTILDLSNFLGTFLLYKAQGENQNLGSAILRSFGFKESGGAPDILDEGIYALSGYAEEAKNKGEDPAELAMEDFSAKGFAAKLLLMFFGILLIGLLAIIILFVLLLIMILRAVLLIILLSISPLAFSAWIFPATSKYFQSWWQNFIRWCIFPIILGFLLYIGITFFNEAKVTVQEGIIASLIQFILFSMFLVVGLWIAFKQSAPISDKILTAVTSALTGLAGFLGGILVTKLGTTAMTSEAWRSVAESFERTPSKFFHNLGIQMQRTTEKIQAEKEKPARERVEAFKGDTDRLREDILINRRNKALVGLGLTTIIEKGKLEDWDTDLIELIKENRTNPYFQEGARLLKKKRPDFYYQYLDEENFKKDTETLMRSLNISQIEAEGLATKNKVLNTILESTAEDLRKIEWNKVLSQLRTKNQLGNFFNEAIYNPQTRIEPEDLATIFRSMDAKTRNQWVNEFQTTLMQLKNYQNIQQLQDDLRREGYSANSYLRALFKLQ